MKLIVAVSENWGIGRCNDLLFNIPEDMAHFVSHTLGKTVLMGRMTLDSFPGGRALPRRRNIVLTKNPDFKRENVEVAYSVQEAVSMAGDDSFVIGGDAVYRLLLPYCDTAIITKVYAAPPADKFFPNLDESGEWAVDSMGEVQKSGELNYQFINYRRINL